MIEVLKQMVAELEYVLDCINQEQIPFDGDDFHEALRLGRQAIAGLESQEPVIDKSAATRIATSLGWSPQRTWVGLTYEEESELIRLAHNHAGIRFYIQAAEAKLKEKNT
jgi:hypothetical protein